MTKPGHQLPRWTQSLTPSRTSSSYTNTNSLWFGNDTGAERSNKGHTGLLILLASRVTPGQRCSLRAPHTQSAGLRFHSCCFCCWRIANELYSTGNPHFRYWQCSPQILAMLTSHTVGNLYFRCWQSSSQILAMLTSDTGSAPFRHWQCSLQILAMLTSNTAGNPHFRYWQSSLHILAILTSDTGTPHFTYWQSSLQIIKVSKLQNVIKPLGFKPLRVSCSNAKNYYYLFI